MFGVDHCLERNLKPWLLKMNPETSLGSEGSGSVAGIEHSQAEDSMGGGILLTR